MDTGNRAQVHVSFGDRLADRVAAIGGIAASIFFGAVLFGRMLLNSEARQDLGMKPFNP